MILVVPPNHTRRFAYPCQSIVSLATVLKTEGIPAAVMDCQFYKDFSSKLLEMVENDRTVGFYTTTYSFLFVRSMAKTIKAEFPDAVIMLGGPLASYQSSEFVEEFADIVVSGEAENSLPRILSGEKLENIPGVSFRNEDGKVVENARLESFTDLNTLALPAWDMFNYRNFTFTQYKKQPLVSLMTSRGCAYGCIYCSSRLVHGMKTRALGIDRVVEEIEWDINRFGVREIHIVDDDFTFDTDRVKELCEKIISRGINKKVVFAKPNAIRPDRGDQEMFHLLRRAGFYYVAVAVENANKDISQKLGRNSNFTLFNDTIDMAKKAGLFVATFYLMGSPFDTKETMRNNLKFALKSKTDIAFFFSLRPFPGTALYTILLQAGKLDGKKIEEIASCNDLNQVLYCANDWTEEDLPKIIKHCYRRFYLAPMRILRLIWTLPKFVSNPLIPARLFFNTLIGGSPASDSGKAFRDSIADPTPPKKGKP